MAEIKTLDFIVLGAAKSGTTSLFQYVRTHPEIFIPPGKEEPFFSRDSLYEQGPERYLKHNFSQAPAGMAWGTITPEYLMGGAYGTSREGAPHNMDPKHGVGTVPSRIHSVCPDVKLIVILRDPARRALSHYQMAVLHGWEERSFEQAIKDEFKPGNLESARSGPSECNYVVQGEYGRLLEPYVDLFGRARVLPLFTEDLAARPREVVVKLLEFLELDSQVELKNLGRRYRPGATARRIGWLDLYALRARISSSSSARRLWYRLPNGLRTRVSGLYSQTALGVRLWNRKAEEIRPEPDILQCLHAHYEADARRLNTLLGCSIPWERLSGSGE
jgi:hypothetical protein